MQTNLTLAASLVEPRPDIATVDQRDACHQFPVKIKQFEDNTSISSIHLNVLLYSVRKFEEQVQCRNTRSMTTRCMKTQKDKLVPPRYL